MLSIDDLLKAIGHDEHSRRDMKDAEIYGVLEQVNPIKSYKISIHDDFTDFHFLQLYFLKNSGITVLETPVSIFESLCFFQPAKHSA
ncbi:MAG: hypothetical protein V7K23_05615 [Nostoc sp.]